MDQTIKPVRPYFDAAAALIAADTTRGARAFLDQLVGHWDHLPNRFYQEGLHPIDDALETCAHFARDVAKEWAARRWKAATSSLNMIFVFQWIYRIRLHMESLERPEGIVLRGYVYEGEPRLEVWEGDSLGSRLLFVLSPFASQDRLDGAIAGWRAGYESGKRAGMRKVSRAVERIMETT